MELHSFYQDIWYKLGLVYDAIGNKKRLKNILVEVNDKFSKSFFSFINII